MRQRHEAEPFEKRERGVERIFAGTLIPLEAAGIATPRNHVERRRRQIDAMDLCLAMRAESIAGVPESPYDPRGETPGAARPLVGGIGGDPLRFEAVDSAVGVVAGHLVEAAVDHRRHAWNGQRGLRQIGRHDNAASSRRSERAILRVGVERSVQRHHLDVGAGKLLLQMLDGALDLRRAGKKAQDLTVRLRQRVSGGIRHRFAGRVLDGDRVQPARHVDDGATVEKRGDARGVQGRRHDHQAQVVARAPRLPRQGDGQVGVDAALVKFVEHHGPKVR